MFWQDNFNLELQGVICVHQWYWEQGFFLPTQIFGNIQHQLYAYCPGCIAPWRHCAMAADEFKTPATLVALPATCRTLTAAWPPTKGHSEEWKLIKVDEGVFVSFFCAWPAAKFLESSYVWLKSLFCPPRLEMVILASPWPWLTRGEPRRARQSWLQLCMIAGRSYLEPWNCRKQEVMQLLVRDAKAL